MVADHIRHSRFRQPIRVLVAAGALVALAATIVDLWSRLAEVVMSANKGDILVGAVFVVLAILSNMASWWVILKGFGYRIPFITGARIFFISQIGKYLPGSVWPVMAQVSLGTDHNIPRIISTTAATVALMIGVVAGSVVGGIAVITSNPVLFSSYSWVLAVVPVGLVVLSPPVMHRLIALLMRLTRREGDVPRLPFTTMASAAGLSVVMWLMLGAHTAMLARSLGAQQEGLYTASVGAYAFAWIAGFVVVILPAGIGLREGILLIAFEAALGRPGALALALLSRFTLVLVDLVAALMAFATGGFAASSSLRDTRLMERRR